MKPKVIHSKLIPLAALAVISQSALAQTKLDTNSLQANATNWSIAPSTSATGTFNTTISAANAASLSLGGVDLSIGRLTFGTMNGPVNISGGNTITINNGTAIDARFSSQNITINAPVVITAAGNTFEADNTLATTLTFNNTITSATHPIVWRAGTGIFAGGGSYSALTIHSRAGITSAVRLGADNGIATNAQVTIGLSNGSAQLDLAGFNQSLAGITRGGTSPATIGNSSTTTNSVLTLTGTSSYAGLIQDSIGSGTRKVGVTINGGALTLSAANTYTGTTTVTAGSLSISSTGSLASGNALTLGASGTADFANAGQTLGAVSNTNTAVNALNFSNASGTVTLASLTGAGNTRFGSNGTVTGGISSGTVTSVGTLNANISGGSVTVGGVATIGTMTSGTANLNGATSSINTLNGGTVNLGTTVLSVSNGTTSGSITGAGGSLTKTSGGTLTLSGSNTYGGATNVNGGTLNIASDGSTYALSAVTVSNSGSALIVNGTVGGSLVMNASTTLSGTGTITGNTTISGFHNPGNSPGIQTFIGNLDYRGGSSVVNWELNGNTVTNLANPNAIFDQIIVGGNLNFTELTSVNLIMNGFGSTILWSDSLWNTNQSWTLFDVAGTTNNFVNLILNTNNWLDSLGNEFNTARSGNSFSLSLSGNDVLVNYNVIPEPSAALLGGLGLLALLRRRRN